MIQLSLVTNKTALLFSIDASINRFRAYLIQLKPNALGFLCLYKKWGRIYLVNHQWFLSHNNWFGETVMTFKSPEKATYLFKATIQNKEKKGYSKMPLNRLIHTETEQLTFQFDTLIQTPVIFYDTPPLFPKKRPFF